MRTKRMTAASRNGAPPKDLKPALAVLPIGAKVRVHAEGPVGVVTGVMLRKHDHVLYEVSWCDGMCHECKWLEAFEVEPLEETDRTTIGFHTCAEK